jgi:hypothetical protein
MKFGLTRKSSNRKTGPIPVSISPKSTCPATGQVATRELQVSITCFLLQR